MKRIRRGKGLGGGGTPLSTLPLFDPARLPPNDTKEPAANDICDSKENRILLRGSLGKGNKVLKGLALAGSIKKLKRTMPALRKR
jgi:hypothetical protein